MSILVHARDKEQLTQSSLGIVRCVEKESDLGR